MQGEKREVLPINHLFHGIIVTEIGMELESSFCYWVICAFVWQNLLNSHCIKRNTDETVQGANMDNGA